MRLSLGSCVLIAGAVFFGPGVGAQEPPASSPQLNAVIVGRVTDTLGAPLPHCFVRLEGARSATLCDSAGRFRLPSLGHAVTTFEVRRLGYVPGRFSVIALGDSMQVRVQLVPVATVLPPITVTAPREAGLNPALAERGFYRRMRAGQTGLFVTQEELERLRPQRVTQVLQDRPGIKITWVGQGGSEPVPLVWGRNFCLLNVFVDGIEIAGIYHSAGGRRGGVSFLRPGFAQQETASLGGLGLDAFIQPHAIAAIEIYPSGPAAPIEFRSANACGAIVIWTRAGMVPVPTDSARVQPPPADTSGPGRRA